MLPFYKIFYNLFISYFLGTDSACQARVPYPTFRLVSYGPTTFLEYPSY